MAKERGKETEGNVYSHSRLWLYENCPESYKIKYIDKAFPDIPKSIEAFLGDIVHQALEWMYEEKKNGKLIELDDVIRHFAICWKEKFSQNIRINGFAEFYFNKGIKFIADYYQKNFPFKENTIEIEKRIVFPLDESGKYKIQGYVDRIVFNENGEYEVHDYKTNNAMKTQAQVDLDRQLGFYHIGLEELFGKQIKVKLIWHFLAHNKTITSRRTEAQLGKLKTDTIELIKKIESTAEWNSCGKAWCDWCNFKRKNSLLRYM